MKSSCRSCLRTVVIAVLVLCLLNGSDGQVTPPENTVGLAGETFTLKADSTAVNDLQWIRNDATIVSTDCVSVDTSIYTATDSDGDGTSCDLSGTLSTERSGIYTATSGDPVTFNYKAVVVSIDSAPTCEVTSQPIFDGDEVICNCSASYSAKGADHTNEPTVAWDTACGGTADSSHTSRTPAVSGTLYFTLTRTASGCEVPECDCTITFNFLPSPSEAATSFATNDVTYPCSCPSVSVWCCPEEATISPAYASGLYPVPATFTCSSNGYHPDAMEYTWSGTHSVTGDISGTGSTITLTEEGTFSLTCTANANFTCTDVTTTLSGTQDADVVITTVSAAAGNDTDTGSDSGLSDETKLIIIVVFSILFLIALLWLFILCYIFFSKSPKRRRRLKTKRSEYPAKQWYPRNGYPRPGYPRPGYPRFPPMRRFDHGYGNNMIYY